MKFKLLYQIVLLFLSAFLTVNGFPQENAAFKFAESTERSYIQTDREIMVAGDKLFFKLYVIETSTQHLSNKSHFAYLCLRGTNQKNIATCRVYLDNGMAHGSIYLPDTLHSGYYQLFSFTNCMRNAGESAYFQKTLFIANRFDKVFEKVSDNHTQIMDENDHEIQKVALKLPDEVNLNKGIHTDKKVYKKQEKIKLDISFTDISPKSFVSISVSQKSPYDINSKSIQQWFLQDKLKLNDSTYYLDTFHKLKDVGIAEDQAKSMALEMFRKKQKPSTNCFYLPELNGQVLQGYVNDASNGNAISDSYVFLCAIDSIANLKYAKTDSNGMFRFLLDNYYNGKNLVLKMKGNDKSEKVSFRFDKKFDFQSSEPIAGLPKDIQLNNYILLSQNILTVQKIYRSKYWKKDTCLMMNKPNPNCKSSVYSNPTIVVYPSDYEKLNDFSEISTEILPTLSVSHRYNQSTCTMMDTKINTYMKEEPAIFLNGILMDNLENIIHMGTEQLKKIECVNETRVYGDFYFDGILSICSPNLRMDGISLKNSVNFFWEENLKPTTFSNETRIKELDKAQPDFRQTMYWNPSVELSKSNPSSIEFYSSDLDGEYRVIIEGVGSDGKIIHGETTFTVEP